MIKIKDVKVITTQDWDGLIQDTYGKVYNFQQQEGCKSRGTFTLDIPSEYDNDAEMNDSIPEEVNGEEMGVKFDVWLARDPKQPLKDERDDRVQEQWTIDLFWERNFYPDIYTVANDLYTKGLIDKGKYMIEIDW